MLSLYSQTFDSGAIFIPPKINFPAGPSIPDSSTVGTLVGTATLSGFHSGSASWSLTVSAGGKYAIGAVNGQVTVAAALTAGTDSITIHDATTGLSLAVNITVTSGAAPRAGTVFHEAGQF